MITSVRMVNFKNFADETLKVGPFTIIVGANASGKSNIRDAFRFLHGIGRGYTLAEILGGKYGPGGQPGVGGDSGGAQRNTSYGPSLSRLTILVLPWGRTGLSRDKDIILNQGRCSRAIQPRVGSA